MRNWVLQFGYIVVVVQAVDTGCRVPGRTRGELIALQQHHVAPTQLGEMIKNRAANQPPANDYRLCMCFQ
jgi:hypothetical protein